MPVLKIKNNGVWEDIGGGSAMPIIYEGSAIKVHFPYRGHGVGDTQIIETQDKVILIDVGKQGSQEALINYMVENDIAKIDYLIISHYHEDHIGGFDVAGIKTILNSENIDTDSISFILPHGEMDWSRIIDSADLTVSSYATCEATIKGLVDSSRIIIPTKDGTGGDELVIDENTKIVFDNISAEYFEDYYDNTYNCHGNPESYTSYNNFSLVTTLYHYDNVFMFTGDIEALAESKIFADMPDKIDVYKFEHHGLNHQANKQYLQKLNPKYAIIQDYLSDYNDSRRTKIIEQVSKYATIFSNTLSGNIVVHSNKNGVNAYSDNGALPDMDVYTLNAVTPLYADQDLNNILTPGTYFCNSASTANKIQNVPDQSASFKLIVEKTLEYHQEYYRQLFISNNPYAPSVYSRVLRSNEISPWACLTQNVAGRALKSGDDLNNCLDPIVYYSDSSTTTGTLQNVPVGVVNGFRLEVKQTNWSDRYQIIYANTLGSNLMYYRLVSKRDGEYQYKDWFPIESSSTLARLDLKTKIAADSDLDNYTTAGSYAIVTTSDAGSIANTPNSSCGTLVVTSMRSTDEDGARAGCYQIFYAYTGEIYYRSIIGTVSDGAVWSSWVNTGNAVPTSRTINNKALTSDIVLTASDVGAAPDGFGLMLPRDISVVDLAGGTSSDFTNGLGNGWYRIANQSLTVAGYTDSNWYVHVKRYSAKYMVQELIPFSSYNCKLVRWVNNGVTTEEWENPPMIANTEYRTTERSAGNPVYIKLVEFGPLPNNTEKSVTAMPANANLISFDGYAVGNSYNVPIPGYYGIKSVGSTQSAGTIWLSTTIDMSSYNGFITIKYTK